MDALKFRAHKLFIPFVCKVKTQWRRHKIQGVAKAPEYPTPWDVGWWRWCCKKTQARQCFWPELGIVAVGRLLLRFAPAGETSKNILRIYRSCFKRGFIRRHFTNDLTSAPGLIDMRLMRTRAVDYLFLLCHWENYFLYKNYIRIFLMA